MLSKCDTLSRPHRTGHRRRRRTPMIAVQLIFGVDTTRLGTFNPPHEWLSGRVRRRCWKSWERWRTPNTNHVLPLLVQRPRAHKLPPSNGRTNKLVFTLLRWVQLDVFFLEWSKFVLKGFCPYVIAVSGPFGTSSTCCIKANLVVEVPRSDVLRTNLVDTKMKMSNDVQTRRAINSETINYDQMSIVKIKGWRRRWRSSQPVEFNDVGMEEGQTCVQTCPWWRSSRLRLPICLMESIDLQLDAKFIADATVSHSLADAYETRTGIWWANPLFKAVKKHWT